MESEICPDLFLPIFFIHPNISLKAFFQLSMQCSFYVFITQNVPFPTIYKAVNLYWLQKRQQTSFPGHTMKLQAAKLLNTIDYILNLARGTF